MCFTYETAIEKTSKYSEKQAEKLKNLCKKLANLLYRSSCCLILDDEKYFTYDGSNMQGNDNYYSNDKLKCPDSVRFAGKVSHIQLWYIQAIISSIEVRSSQLGHLYIRIYSFFSPLSITQTHIIFFGLI